MPPQRQGKPVNPTFLRHELQRLGDGLLLSFDGLEHSELQGLQLKMSRSNNAGAESTTGSPLESEGTFNRLEIGMGIDCSSVVDDSSFELGGIVIEMAGAATSCAGSASEV